MKQFIKNLFGITEMERAIAETQQRILEAEQAKKAAEEKALEAIEEARLAKEAAEQKLKIAIEKSSVDSSKEDATERGEPWIAVLDTKINKENVRNGFFELDWNEYFVVQLKLAGYTGSSDEEIVERWFQDLCRNIGNEVGVDMERRGSGYINVNNIGNGKSEIS